MGTPGPFCKDYVKRRRGELPVPKLSGQPARMLRPTLLWPDGLQALSGGTERGLSMSDVSSLTRNLARGSCRQDRNYGNVRDLPCKKRAARGRDLGSCVPDLH